MSKGFNSSKSKNRTVSPCAVTSDLITLKFLFAVHLRHKLISAEKYV